MARLLQIVGLFALLGWTAAGLGAWFLTKDQVHITFEEGAGTDRAADDPVALLGERIGDLEQDVRALADALGSNLAALDENLGEGADRRIAGLRAHVDEGLARLAARVDRARIDPGELRELHAALSALQVEVRALAASTAAASTPLVVPTATGPDAVEVASETPAVGVKETDEPPGDEASPEPGEIATTATAEPEAAPPPPERRRSFLAFRLPSDDFRFAGERTWEVIGSLSRVGFDGKSTLHDFTGATTRVRGEIVLDPVRPHQQPSGSIRVDARSLDTGLEDRNTAMYEHLGTDEHQGIVFELTGFTTDVVDAAKMHSEGAAKGRMSIHGVTHDIEMPVKLSVDASRRLLIEGEARLKMSDYGVVVPSKLGLINVTDEVKIWIALRARPQAKESN